MQQARVNDLTIVVPAYNEEKRIRAPVAALRSYLSARADDYEVIFVDDGSRDATAAAIGEAAGGWREYRLLRLGRNEGKGAAVRAGVLEARKRDVCFMDADLSTDLEMLPRLQSALTDASPVVIGSRDVRGAEVVRHQSPLREYSAKLFNLWIQLWLLPGLWDTQCGFKMFRARVARELFESLEEKRFGFDVEVLYRARRRGYPIVEVPVRWTNVEGSRVSPLRDGLAMAWQVVRLRWKS